MINLDSKAPGERVDYDLDWTRNLVNDSIATSIWTVIQGSVVIDTDVMVSPMTKVWVTGGELGETCQILNSVTTSNGEIYEETIVFDIKAH